MSTYGKHWKIDGLIAGPVARDPFQNGRYTILFAREHGAALEKIEAIHWANPEIKKLPGNRGLPGLPDGYGFELMDIKYHHNTQVFEATVRTAKQYLGDVTGYQAQIDALSAENAAKQTAITELEAQLAEADETAIALYEAMNAGALEGEVEA